MAWKGKVVLVGGVGSGLGSAVASLLGSAGASVVGVARGSQALERVEAAARARGWSFRGMSADLSVRPQVDAVLSKVIGEFGRLDGASLNMGRWVPGDTLLHKTTDAEWSEGLADNLNAVFQTCRGILPALIDHGGGAIVLTSASERVRWLGNASYCVAKGGLVELTKKLARDYRQFGIRVNAVLPGNMEHDLDPASPPDESTPLPLRDESGVGGWEVARSIRYLLSDESRWVSGALLTVDGGFSLRGKEQRPNAPP